MSGTEKLAVVMVTDSDDDGGAVETNTDETGCGVQLAGREDDGQVGRWID